MLRVLSFLGRRLVALFFLGFGGFLAWADVGTPWPLFVLFGTLLFIIEDDWERGRPRF